MTTHIPNLYKFNAQKGITMHMSTLEMQKTASGSFSSQELRLSKTEICIVLIIHVQVANECIVYKLSVTQFVLGALGVRLVHTLTFTSPEHLINSHRSGKKH